MTYTCLIVDDEPLARKGIQLHVAEIPDLKLVGDFGNALKAGDFLESNPVDIMFLDIQMPGITGIEFIKKLKTPPAIILTTAYTEYAVEAFELDVIDYVLKPIKFERFSRAVIKAMEYVKLRNTDATEFEDFTEEYVYIKADRKYVRLYYKEIQFIQGMKDYVMIHTPDKKYMTAMNVKTILGQLPSQLFSRVSKSYIVNINKIESVDTDMIYIEHHDIPLGNTYKEAFLKTHIKDRLLKR